MANYDRNDWGAGFPFSDSPFKTRTLSGAIRILPVDLQDVRINDSHIPEGRARDSTNAPNIALPDESGPFLRDIDFPPIARPFAQRPIARQAGLRLLLLESFVWGSRNTPPLPRTRPDHTLIWVTNGFAQLGFPKRRETLARDAVRFVPAGTAFSFFPRPEIRGYVLLIAPSLVQDTDPIFPHSYIAGNIGDGGEALFVTLKELEAEGATRPPGDALHCLLGVLALRLTRLQPPIYPSAPPQNRNPAERPLAERFLALAATRMQHGHTISDLAEELGVGTAALDRACQIAKGKRAIDLLYRLRLDHAIVLLREGQHNPAQISRLLGYTSHAHFTRAFVEATGRRPEYFQNQATRPGGGL